MSDVFVEHKETFDNSKLTKSILFAMLGAIVLGCLYHELAQGQSPLVQVLDQYVVKGVFELVGQYFVRALKMIVVPLVLFSLIAGLTSGSASGEAVAGKDLGLRAGYTFLLYLGTTMLAVTLALMLAVLVDPGAGVTGMEQAVYASPPKKALIDVLAAFMPTNIIAALGEGNMLPVIVISMIFGYAMNHCGAAGHRLAQFCQDANELVTRVVFLIMAMAPYGVFALVFEVFAQQGVYFMASLAAYFLTVAGALVLHGLLVYSAIVRICAKVSVIMFWRKIRQVMLFAFSTASSAATIGINLRNATERFGVRNDIASFTIPLGATINMDGTAIMQGVAVVFIAGAFGIELSMLQYIEVILLATLASVGTAAVPSAGLVTLSIVLLQVNLPAEAIGLIIGVDRLLDMMRTSVNVAGDAAITLAVGAREAGLDKTVYAAS